MPRCARPKVEGWPVHVLQRGHNKRACFRDANDHSLYMALLKEAVGLHPTAIHAYVLMTNHVHIVATPARMEMLSRALKFVGERYAMHFNRKYGLTGGIWEGRFKAGLIDSESYLLCCYRYVELNPVRAGMVSHPAEYPWSSHRANAWGEGSPLVSPHSLYTMLGATPELRTRAYRKFASLDPPESEICRIRNATASGRTIASDAALPRLGAQLGGHLLHRGVGRPRRAR
ncbi:MAG TPA: transposase [Usitatibacter sp.]|nr:transposase [Usitatibacter sp.]